MIKPKTQKSLVFQGIAGKKFFLINFQVFLRCMNIHGVFMAYKTAINVDFAWFVVYLVKNVYANLCRTFLLPCRKMFASRAERSDLVKIGKLELSNIP